jgi:MFS family permease
MTNDQQSRLRGVAIMFIINVVVTIGLVMIAPLLPVFAKRAGASGAWMGALFAADMVARTIAMPLCGRASDRLGRRPFLLVGLVLFISASFAFTLTSGRIALLVVRTLQGLGAGMIIPIIMVYFGEFSASRREAFSMGTLNISFFGALAVGPFLGGLLESRFSLETPFYFLAAAGVVVGVVVGLIAFWFLPETTGRARSSEQDEPASSEREAAEAPPTPPALTWRELLASRNLRRLLGHRFLISFGISTAWAFVPLYAVRGLGLSTYDAGIAVGSITLFTAILISPGGLVADRLGRWSLITVGTLLLAISLGAVSWSGDLWGLVVVCGAMGLAQAFYMPAAYALVVVEGRRMGMGATLGLYSTSLTLGLAVGPLMSGLVVDGFGRRATFLLCAVLAAIATALVFFRPTEKQVYVPLGKG